MKVTDSQVYHVDGPKEVSRRLQGPILRLIALSRVGMMCCKGRLADVVVAVQYCVGYVAWLRMSWECGLVDVVLGGSLRQVA